MRLSPEKPGITLHGEHPYMLEAYKAALWIGRYLIRAETFFEGLHQLTYNTIRNH